MLLQLKAIREERSRKGPGGLSLTAEVFEIIPSLNVIELRKSHGDSSPYKQVIHSSCNNVYLAPLCFYNRDLKQIIVYGLVQLCERLLNELDASSQI